MLACQRTRNYRHTKENRILQTKAVIQNIEETKFGQIN